MLSGIGLSEVWTMGSFEYSVEIDEDKYLFTWHVVTTSQLSYQAVIGADIFAQVSLKFNRNGVEFSREETDNFCMQISEISQDDEI